MTTQWLPDRSQTLLLRASLLPGDEGLDALSQWSSTTKLDDLDGGSIRLLPLLSHAIEENGGKHGDLDRIRGIHRRSLYTSTMLRSMAASVLPALAAPDADPIVIDGFAIAQRAYGDLSTRPIDDLDVFVRATEFTKTAKTLESLGFAADESTANSASVYSGRGALFRRGPVERVRVHRALLSARGDTTFDAHAIRASTMRTEKESALRVLSPTDMLLRVLMRAPQPRKYPNCRWAADAALLIRNVGPIDWPLAKRYKQ